MMVAIIEVRPDELVEEEVIELTMMAMLADKTEEADVAVVEDITTSTINLLEVTAMIETSEEEETKKKPATRSDVTESVAATQTLEPTNELTRSRECRNRATEPEPLLYSSGRSVMARVHLWR